MQWAIGGINNHSLITRFSFRYSWGYLVSLHRIIAATALYLNVPLISRDRKIQLSTVNTIW